MFTNLLFISRVNALLGALWQGLWFNVGAIACMVIPALVLYKVFSIKLKNQKAAAAQEALKQSELLNYAIENEQKARQEAKHINQTKRELLARMSREVRTPMNGVIGMVSLLKETQLTTEQREYCETIRTCGETLLATLNDVLFEDILAYSKVESGKIGLEKDFDLKNCLEEVIDIFASKSAQSGFDLVYNIDSTVPPIITANSVLIRQVLINLIENAVRFTKQGEVIVNVELVKTNADDKVELGFEISDTGTGIPSDKMTALTKELSHSDTAKQSQQGSLKGLLICKKIVDLMGGRITIQPNVIKGTTVRFTINTKVGIQPVRDHLLQGMQGKKILIIDDNVASLNALRSQLEQWKLLPVTASTGKQALEILMQTQDIDLILADMEMPEMNGVSIAKAIRRQLPTTPIILLSCEQENFKNNPGLFNSVITKPIKQNMLSELIFSNLKHEGETVATKEQFAKQKLSIDFSQQHPLRILIAEDDRVNQKLMLRILGKLGYKPDVAQNGKEVLEIVSQAKYDVVLMDVQMPEMDGLEATRMIRLCLTTQPVIIAMTANAMQGDREECINAGMDEYISKPVNIEELVILLEKFALQPKDTSVDRT